MSWQPNAPLANLKQRAALLKRIRRFFEDKGVMEVDTPAMSQATVTDIHLHTFTTTFVGPGAAQGQKLFLQTSPEFHMKRLLCAGSGAIYQICKSFRNEESGRFHNPEFTMLEWYQPDYEQLDLVAEVDELLRLVLNTQASEVLSYQQVFIKHVGLDPLSVSVPDLRAFALSRDLGDFVATEQCRDTLLQLIFCFVIEPNIGVERPIAIINFPASQAALARIDRQDPRIASRFEFYYQGIELANGFHELSNAQEQLQRFESDNKARLKLGKETQSIDFKLISALESGLPDCAGVALGIDRLLMLATKSSHINQVISFDIENC